jgi:GNAT superfamily N-acetyltransferase
MITIRRAVSGDVPTLVPLLSQLFAQEAEFTPNPVLQAKGLRAIIDGKDVGTILVAERDGKAVGMVNLLYTISTALGARVAILEDMIVDAGARSGGIGSKLIAQAIETARADGCQRVTVLSDSDNANAHRFYKRFGFERSAMVPFRLALAQTIAV